VNPNPHELAALLPALGRAGIELAPHPTVQVNDQRRAITALFAMARDLGRREEFPLSSDANLGQLG